MRALMLAALVTVLTVAPAAAAKIPLDGPRMACQRDLTQIGVGIAAFLGNAPTPLVFEVPDVMSDDPKERHENHHSPQYRKPNLPTHASFLETLAFAVLRDMTGADSFGRNFDIPGGQAHPKHLCFRIAATVVLSL